MPYEYKKKQGCNQAGGEKGTYTTKKRGAKKQKCWKSKAAFDRARIARHAQESDVDEKLDTLSEIIIEKILERIDGNYD
jgi:hypothetical protein|tara:strand:+ start:2990 stop:3226 length:237 start_codon:yes stop_codon:yes gene_type:complete